MLWQYRTILFEFTKDGLLGDKYVDDEEMEKTLNQLGGQSWELVDVTLLQDGVLAFLKRPAGEEMGVEEIVEAVPVAPPPPIIKSRSVAAAPKVIAVEQIQEEAEPIRGLERQRKPTMHNDDSDFIGGIKIS
jgi:hypothetical protein